MLPVHPVLHELAVFVDVVEDGVGVGLVAGRENDHLEVLVCLLEALHNVGPYIYTCLFLLFIN